MVDIVVVTYNHEKYIAQALQSILDQECDFDYRIIIGDDHSTDDTGKICKEFQNKYPERILYIRNNENLGLAKNYQNIFSKCTAQYIAILEGDDYWIDKRKLQKQVDILESRPEVGLVHTGSYTLFENGEMKKNHLSIPNNMLDGKLYNSLLLKRNTISPMTVCFRRSIFEKYVDFAFFVQNNFKTIDYPLWLELAQHSQFAYIIEPTAIYRSLNSSVSHKGTLEERISFYEVSRKSKLYYQKKYPIKNISYFQLISKTIKTIFNLCVEYNSYEKAKEFRSQLYRKELISKIMYFFSYNRFLFNLYRLGYRTIPFLSHTKQFFFTLIKR